MYSYAPHRPTSLRKWMPDKSTRDVTWQWIKEALPTLKEAKETYDVANILARPSSLCTLTQLKSPDPLVQDIHTRFIKELTNLSKKVKKRNHPYDYLDPQNVACSIDI